MPASRTFGAAYSDCGLYRYSLWRAWGLSGRTILWVMLNPSTADDLGNNDATIARCERRSVAWGFDRMEVVNLFAFRSTEPKGLRNTRDPVGPENDRRILEAAGGAEMILCAWGSHGLARSRSATVRALFGARPLHCLALTRSGQPAHPLYLSYECTPKPFESVVRVAPKNPRPFGERATKA